MAVVSMTACNRNEDIASTTTEAPTEATAGTTTESPTTEAPTTTVAPTTEAPTTVHKHSYTFKVTKEATCKETGVKTFSCSCGDTYTENIAKTNHNASDWKIVTNATCNSEGTKVKNCTICGTQIDSSSIAKSEHKSSDWIVTTEASCSSNGSKHKICTVCNAELATETITSGGAHNYYWDGDNSTRTRKCSGCSYTGITEYCYNGAWGYYDDEAASVLWNHVNVSRNETWVGIVDDWGNPAGGTYVSSLISDGNLTNKAKNRAVEAAVNFDHGSIVMNVLLGDMEVLTKLILDGVILHHMQEQ